jgi:hypothetical protein
MRLVRATVLGAAMCLFLPGCISFQVAPSPAPETFSVEIFLCKKIDDTGELYQPLDITSEFAPDGQDIICFVRMKNIRKAIRLKWKWYDPDLKLFKETKDMIINAEEEILETISAIDRINVPAESKSEGQWTVVVIKDREFVGRKTFEVKR